MTSGNFLSSGRWAARSAALALAYSLSVGVAQADSTELGKADAAWHQGELEQAMALYQGALDAGGLSPADVVTAYSRIGTVKAALKDKGGALSAFRTAATINPEFDLPADAGPVAKSLYEQARGEAGKSGEFLNIALSVPEKVPAKKPFSVVAVVPEAFVVLVSEVEVEVTNSASGKTWKGSQPAAAEVTIEVPKKMTSSGQLVVHARLLDDKKNAWAEAESKVTIEGGARTGMDSAEVDPFAAPTPPPVQEDSDKGGFMSGPMPWIIGGAAVLLAGVAVVYVATRPGDEASVGAPTWTQ